MAAFDDVVVITCSIGGPVANREAVAGDSLIYARMRGSAPLPGAPRHRRTLTLLE